MQTTVEIRRMDDWPAEVLRVIRGWMPEAFGDGGGYTWATMDWRVVAFQDARRSARWRSSCATAWRTASR